MSRMRAGEVAVLLDRLGQEFPEEVRKLAAHIEAVAAEDSFTRLVRDVSETVGEQRGFIAEQREFIKEQRGFLLSQQAVLAAATKAMESVAEAQEKANEIQERKLLAQERHQDHERKMATLQQTHEQALQKTTTEKLLVPTISGLVGIVTGALGAFLSGLLASGATP